MKTLSLLSRKGGSGKTTLSIHLAVVAQEAGRRVLLIDTDPQKSVTRWFEARPNETPELVSTTADKVKEVLRAARADGVDLAVIDSRPSAEHDAALIAALSDFIVIPTRPAFLDLHAIADTISVLRGSRRPGAAVLNGCPPTRGLGEAGLTREARIVVSGYHIEVAPISVVSRSALSSALNDGRAVTELEPDGKAAVEMRKLWKWTEAKLWARQQA